MKLRYFIILFFLISFLTKGQTQLFLNGDFESGSSLMCHCPTGYTCWNDAGRVVDGIHPVFMVGNHGCMINGIAYASSLGAHSGIGYMYFYAGSDRIISTDTLFGQGKQIELCVWYSGPQGAGAPGQNTIYAHFSFGVDGMQVGPDVLVPTGTVWMKYCYTVLVLAGAHNFCIMSGGSAEYSMWFDDFSVGVLCTLPIVDLGNDTTLCHGEILTLDATTADAIYLWHDNSTNPTFNVSKSGIYYVQVTDSCGIVTDTVEVSYIPPPNIDLGNDTLLCLGETLTLNVITPGATYLWQDNSTTQTYKVNLPGIYWVHVTDSCGTVSDTINVFYTNPPVIDLGNDTTLCEREVLTLDATTPNVTYLWQDNSTNATYKVFTAGSFMVHVTDSCGSTATDVITVSYNPLPLVNLGNDTVICRGEIIILDATNQFATYLWQDNSTNAIFNSIQAGTYWVDVTVNDCSNSDTIIVNKLDKPNINLGNDTSICQGSICILDARTPYATYLWQDNSSNPIFTVEQPGEYWVEVTNKCGIESDSINITLEDCHCYLYIPNAFSPNGDNLNDLFFPKSNCIFDEYNLMILNRWGQKIFETNNSDNPWDGIYKGKLCPLGVYVYQLKYKFAGLNVVTRIDIVTLLQ